MGSRPLQCTCCCIQILKPDFKLVKMGFLPLVLLAVVLPQLNAFCLKQGCDKYFDKVKADAKVTGACAVLFEENCCKNVGTFGDAKKLFVVPRGGKGKLCGTSKTLLNAAASVIGAGTTSTCTGPDLKDNVKSLIVMPGCTLEVWDKDSNPERKGSLWYAEEEEKKGANAGNLRDAIDSFAQVRQKQAVDHRNRNSKLDRG